MKFNDADFIAVDKNRISKYMKPQGMANKWTDSLNNYMDSKHKMHESLIKDKIPTIYDSLSLDRKNEFRKKKLMEDSQVVWENHKERTCFLSNLI